MDLITDFQHSLGGPVAGFVGQFWYVFALAAGFGGYWVMFGNPFSARDGAVSSELDPPGDDSDSGGDGGSAD